MNECIIHYDGLSRYDDPVFVTKRTLKTYCELKKNMKNEMTGTIFSLNQYHKKIFRSIGVIEIHASPGLQNVIAKSWE